MFDKQTPLTVANFLKYVNDGDYANSFFHRSIPGFVVQGGGFTATAGGSTVTDVPTDAPVRNEPGISNTRGTVAMAKLGGDPNSATSQFFFNLVDNSQNLDNQNGGFTVFAEVLGNGMQVVDAIAALQTFDFGNAFTDLPLQNYTGPEGDINQVGQENFVLVNGAALTRASDNLTYSVTNSNPSLLTASVTGRDLTLDYAPGQTGTATITVQATDTRGASVTTQFTVTVS